MFFRATINGNFVDRNYKNIFIDFYCFRDYINRRIFFFQAALGYGRIYL